MKYVGTTGAHGHVTPEGEYHFLALTVLAHEALSATELTVVTNVTREDSVDFLDFEFEFVRMYFDQVLEGKHVRVLDKVLAVAEGEEKFALEGLLARSEITFHDQDFLAHGFESVKLSHKTEKHGVDVSNSEEGPIMNKAD